jgi:hypothetical protein
MTARPSQLRAARSRPMSDIDTMPPDARRRDVARLLAIGALRACAAATLAQDAPAAPAPRERPPATPGESPCALRAA